MWLLERQERLAGQEQEHLADFQQPMAAMEEPVILTRRQLLQLQEELGGQQQQL
jgi:hypothetical protein